MAKLSQQKNANNTTTNSDNVVRANVVGMKAKRTRKTIPRDSPPKRSSIYRGVTRHRWTGRYEAHLWDKNCWNEAQNKKGRQGAYDNEEAAAHAYDLAALKYWGPDTILNFSLVEQVVQPKTFHSLHTLINLGLIAILIILQLNIAATQEEAAVAYDMAAIEYRGLNAVTNFDLSRYVKWLKPNKNNNTNNNDNPSNIDTNTSLCPNHHDASGSASLPPLQQQTDTNDAALSQLRPTTATSALGLLLQSSKFKEMMEMTLAAECTSPPPQECDPPQSTFPEDIKTCFESNDFCTYVHQGDDFFVDFNSFMQPMIQFE
ncbi:hypothetical protein DH2020_039265 [Rehmannia glutinosa]|uniref:AP2/ERF domain-containing protein n=1 Tax=Rehmannia glutinosa TaxID=99300 RepID=A0ABR0UWC6_REHGL